MNHSAKRLRMIGRLALCTYSVLVIFSGILKQAVYSHCRFEQLVKVVCSLYKFESNANKEQLLELFDKEGC